MSTDLLLIEAAIGRHASSPFWMKALLHGCRLEVAHPDTFPIVGRTRVPPGTLLTFWAGGGDGGDDFGDFWIVQMVTPENPAILTSNQFYLKGSFTVLAHAAHRVGDMWNEPDLRLQRWWFKWAPQHGGQTPSMARWLGSLARKNGPEEPGEFPGPQDMPRFDPVAGWDF